ncbi:hypothetical protein PLESTB_000603300 [Pleodorina starrii]|uniref:Uncharacterized protein n=1 Tax=Pleodorina starrii TaxID=330485 RepID=A0A9W6BI99_9CHLO|nr:hypothetical protein PLESTM_000424200 [Pleodorina starrii]GLC52270.1 hypothetical protein PLESTB_000603300 [Pleodorina starrii]
MGDESGLLEIQGWAIGQLGARFPFRGVGAKNVLFIKGGCLRLNTKHRDWRARPLGDGGGRALQAERGLVRQSSSSSSGDGGRWPLATGDGGRSPPARLSAVRQSSSSGDGGRWPPATGAARGYMAWTDPVKDTKTASRGDLGCERRYGMDGVK